MVTPGKLLNPVNYTPPQRQFKPIHAYLEESFLRKRCFKDALPDLFEKDKGLELDIVDIPGFNTSKISITSLTKRKNKAHRSCRIKKSLQQSNSPMKKAQEIPQLSYKNYEKFHLPSVKTKLQIKTWSPKQVQAHIKEVIEEAIEEPTVPGPKRVQINDHSKEYSTKLNRVSQVISMIQHEHSY